MQWFDNNFLNNNPDKFWQLLIISSENVKVKIGKYEIENSECEKLLGAKLKWKLNFNDQFLIYVKKLFKN